MAEEIKKGKKISKERLKEEGWKEVGPFGKDFLLFEKGDYQIAWDPETEIVQLVRKKP
ncbi:MAG: hypothetical protein ACE5WD_09715 [Candidatus Aminicenantia bacterium]